MISRSDSFQYPGVELTTYKDEPGTWVAVTRRVFNPEAQTGFETRYFEVAAGGYTSFEKHQHEHVVVVVRGNGSVRLNEEWSEIGPGDVVHVPQWTPHQFKNASDAPFGIVCIVDRERDRPILLQSESDPRASEYLKGNS